VWTAFVDGSNDSQEWYIQNFDIWHIGSHFTLDLVDKTKFYCEMNPSFLVLQGGSLHLNFAEGNTRKYAAPTVQRLLDDGQWIPLPVNSLPNVPGDKGREDLLLFGYEDKDPSMEYIYLTRFSRDAKGNQLFLNLIKTSLFRELSSNKPSMWQIFRVPCTTDYAAADPFGQLITTDITTGKHRLYIFGAKMSLFKNIYTTWIPLRKDGYVDANKTLPSNLGVIPIKTQKYTPRNLKVTDLNHRRVLLSWEEKGIPHGLFGRIGENGALPEADQWKEVELKFEVPIEEEQSQAFASVLVPDSFE